MVSLSSSNEKKSKEIPPVSENGLDHRYFQSQDVHETKKSG